MSNEYLLGSITNEPFYIKGRNILHTDGWLKGKESTELSRFNCMKKVMQNQNINSLEILKEAIQIWKIGKNNNNRMTMTIALYIVCRYRQIPFDTNVIRHIKRKSAFIYKASEIANNLNIEFPRINNGKLILDLCDELGDRSLYNKMKEIYPKARIIRAGNPKATMGSIIYGLAKPTNHKLTQNFIAIKLGLSVFTIRETYSDIKEIIQ